MYSRIIPLIVASTSPWMLMAMGCGDAHPPVDASRTEATVKGFVKLRGKVATGGGKIIFNPSNVERKVAAKIADIKEDGSYSLQSFTGGNEVKFYGPFIKSDPGLALTTRYCELNAGENIVEFDLLGENDRPRGAIYPKNAKPKPSRRR